MDLSISQMLRMQEELFEPHKEKWFPMEPEYGKDFMLFLVEELGEVISIVKKKGNNAIMDDPAVREAFLEEMSDVLMYYHDILLRYHVRAEEISKVYQKKHDRNMGRDYQKQYEELYHNG